eukprot:CAMPEP_0176402844 /NCGR_PEP_ID=MMETSP0126-20121128/49613_1 /TAXON_ID=141414 ORGANISM="Strombidinopsis acuminatum, Strain SPMC142" /NCGR_SAMPLE_ID=MMETSP0126 /ASSEMBLY_ACC=CAM_ASM_000229 /LENGTH=31 /DNA_ID= /DNA_START= /DNA_END= /DNA_ORIENTATION=
MRSELMDKLSDVQKEAKAKQKKKKDINEKLK